ncbi:MAG: P1 family peptidase [Hyphomicrobiaceae bacterium]
MADRLNLITDVAGVLVGHADDARIRTGVTAVLFPERAVASVAILGGAAAVRDTSALAADGVVPTIDGLVLSGGSGFGLDAASGVQAFLAENGRGFPVGPVRVPIVPQAILFDLLNGGDKDWGRYPPYRELGYDAAAAASAGAFGLGSVGAGLGASTVNLKGGLGSASAVTPSGHTVGALVAVNAIGSAVVGDGPHFWAAPYEVGMEFGGLGLPAPMPPEATRLAWKGGRQIATTLAVVATDAALSKAEAMRLAIAAHDGFARALRITHALFDGDTLFAAATGRRPLGDPVGEQIEIGAVAADVVARAIARGVYEATSLGEGERPAGLVSWTERFAAR